MAHCVSETCRKEIRDDWSFCPFCGVDNRPPEHRPHVDYCKHYFYDPAGYCIYCGAGCGGKASIAEWSLRVKLGALCVFVGILGLFGVFLIWAIHTKGGGPGYDWVRSWYDQPRYHSLRSGGGYYSTAGSDDLTNGGIVSMILTFFGVSLIAPKQFTSTYRNRDWFNN